VQTCLRSGSRLQEARSLQVPGHDISHNGHFLGSRTRLVEAADVIK